MNELLAIDEAYSGGTPATEIMYEFRIRQQKLTDPAGSSVSFGKQSTGEFVSAMRTSQTYRCKLVDFETHQGKLEELYRAFVAKAEGPRQADALGSSGCWHSF